MGEIWWKHIDHFRIGMPESEAGVTSEGDDSSLSSDWVFSQEETLANPSESSGGNTELEEPTAASPTHQNQSENPPEGCSPPT